MTPITVESLPDPAHPERVRVDGHEAVNFCSDDYLGLLTHPVLIGTLGKALALSAPSSPEMRR